MGKTRFKMPDGSWKYDDDKPKQDGGEPDGPGFDGEGEPEPGPDDFDSFEEWEQAWEAWKNGQGQGDESEPDGDEQGEGEGDGEAPIPETVFILNGDADYRARKNGLRQLLDSKLDAFIEKGAHIEGMLQHDRDLYELHIQNGEPGMLMELEAWLIDNYQPYMPQ